MGSGKHKVINWMLPLLQREELYNILTAALITYTNDLRSLVRVDIRL